MRWRRLSLSVPTAVALCLAACPKDEEEAEPCGNGALDQGEACDGEELGGQTCATQGFSYGELVCDAACKLDTSGCVNDPCWGYPCEPYGSGPGFVIEDRYFRPANDLAQEWTVDDDYVAFHDFYQQNEEHGGGLRGLLLFVAAGWCIYCDAEADYINDIHAELGAQGIMVLGLVTEDDAGRAASTEYASGYARSHGWSFPAVSGDLPDVFWDPSDPTSVGSVPFHLFLDLRNMRMMGRIGGMAEAKILRAALAELIEGPVWGPAGQRQVSFDCAPGTGSETEPNGLAETPEAAAALPFNLSGVLCPPAVAEGLLIDEDAVDLGTLPAGTVLEVVMRPSDNVKVYPFFAALRLNAAGSALEWEQYGPVKMAASERRHLWVTEVGGHYLLAAYDGRLMSQLYYGESALPPETHSCCEGGPEYTYELEVRRATLSATEDPLSVGASVQARLQDDGPRVYPLTATAGSSYTVRMSSNNYEILDPYLLLYDPVAEAVIDYNDDADYQGGDRDGEITWTAPADQEVLVVASYFWAFYRNGFAPSYTLSVE